MSPRNAEVRFVQLKNCFVNLPRSLVAALNNSDAIVQNVIVELEHKDLAVPSEKTQAKGLRSIYAGWTGAQSTTPSAPLTTGRGRNSKESGETIEIDETFASNLGLKDGQKVGVLLHVDPPLAHTVHVEPLSPTDWEIIELHASFLESNLLFQVRALKNPKFISSPAHDNWSHPMTIHLSPTSTAKVIITSIEPELPASAPFAKIAPDAEVIVAPKARLRSQPAKQAKSRSEASTNRRSVGAREKREYKKSSPEPRSVVLRAASRSSCEKYFEEAYPEDRDTGLTVWVDESVTLGPLKGSTWVAIMLVTPSGLDIPLDPQQQQHILDLENSESGKPATKLVARIRSWCNAPDSKHAALSSSLCRSLEAEDIVGGLVHIEPASRPLSMSNVQRVKIYPFDPVGSVQIELKVRPAEAQAEATGAWFTEVIESEVEDLRIENGNSGPLTDGIVLFQRDGTRTTKGGILRILTDNKEYSKNAPVWFFASNMQPKVDIRSEIPSPLGLGQLQQFVATGIPETLPLLVGINEIESQLLNILSHCSSVLLTGGLGAGKSSFAQLVAHRLCSQNLFYTNIFPCQSLVTDETRIANIKEKFTNLFKGASWGAKLGGHSVVVLDNVDKLCPAETELQTSDNGRSRQISEILSSIIRQYCAYGSDVAVLATSQVRESINSVLIGSGIFKEILNLKAPDKNARRLILESLLRSRDSSQGMTAIRDNQAQRMIGNEDSSDAGTSSAWLAAPSSPISSVDHFIIDSRLDLLTLASRTDGFMPADLRLLLSRAKNECLIRSLHRQKLSSSESPFPVPTFTLTAHDFTSALRNFTPISLRSIPLRNASSSSDSNNATLSTIGGLRHARAVLTETLIHPTLYAPLYAQSPLRLRSGLLLYGYPGCGKTLLASSIQQSSLQSDGEGGGGSPLNFISVKGPELLNKYIGASEAGIRTLFSRAQAAKPCVLFFDEFDSLAPRRGHDSTGVTDRVVNQLLTEMDGAEGLGEGVYVLAATSRPDLIDPALLRPGRLDKSVLCDLPDEADRLDILQKVVANGELHLDSDIDVSNAPTRPNMPKTQKHNQNHAQQQQQQQRQQHSLAFLAAQTEGYTGADLQALIYNAHLAAIHDVLKSPSAGLKAGRASNTSGKKRSDNKHDYLSFRMDSTSTFVASHAAASSPTSETEPKDAAEVEFEKSKKLTPNERHKIEETLTSLQPSPSSPSSSSSSSPSSPTSPKPTSTSKSTPKNQTQTSNPQVQITWPHLLRSLSETPSSLPTPERARLARIYDQFVGGRRAGDMKTGEGSRDVGGRSSLM